MTFDRSHHDEVFRAPAAVPPEQNAEHEMREAVQPLAPEPRIDPSLAELARTSNQPLPLRVLVPAASAPSGRVQRAGGGIHSAVLGGLSFIIGAGATLTWLALFPSSSVVIIDESMMTPPVSIPATAKENPSRGDRAPVASPDDVTEVAPVGAASASTASRGPTPEPQLPFPPFAPRSTLPTKPPPPPEVVDAGSPSSADPMPPTADVAKNEDVAEDEPEEVASAEDESQPPFDKAAAVAAIGRVSAIASACGRGELASVKKTRVAVTFAPSGRVTSALVIGGSLQGTPEGSCVSRAMSGASVPAFSGPHVTVKTTVHVR